MKNKTLIKTLCIVLCVLLVASCTPCGILYQNGLFKFAHRYVKPQENQIKVACVGDSVTYGMTMQHWSKNAYPFVLRQMLGENYCTENFGFSGRTVLSSGDRPYINEKLYTKSLEFEPDIVIFQMGSNDSKPFNWTDKELFLSDYEKLVQSYQNLPSHPKVFICTPPPAFEIGGIVKYSIQPKTIEEEIVPAIKEFAEKNSIPVIDLMELFYGHNELFNDGLHPNKAGGKLLAQTVFEAIKEYEIK